MGNLPVIFNEFLYSNQIEIEIDKQIRFIG
jgi:hypothetical protein